MEVEKWLAEEAKERQLSALKQNQERRKLEEIRETVPQKFEERNKYEGEAAEQAAKLLGTNRHKNRVASPLMPPKTLLLILSRS
ncbi:MAG: hypothetical protein ACPL5F_02405 [Moorellaceae bacterium]